MRYPASDKILNEIKQRIVETANPLKIILFGSAARGEVGPNSDLDILVVIPSGIHRRLTARSIYRNLIGVGFAVDIVVVNEEDIERYKNNIGMVIKPALDQGRVIYAKWKKRSWISHNIPFRFVHDIAELLTGLEQNGINLPEQIRAAAELSDYAVETRYPGPMEPVSEGEYKEAVKIAETVVSWVEGILKSSHKGTNW